MIAGGFSYDWLHHSLKQNCWGKTIDTDDFKVNTFSLGDKEVTVFSHKLGLTVFNWEEAEIYYELRGEVDTDALTDYAISLGLFN